MEEFMNDVIKALKMKLGEGYRIFPKEQRKNNELVLYGVATHLSCPQINLIDCHGISRYNGISLKKEKVPEHLLST